MKFMNLFTGRKMQGTTSPQNEKCYSIENINQLQKRLSELNRNKFNKDIVEKFVCKTFKTNQLLLKPYLSQCLYNIIVSFRFISDEEFNSLIDFIFRQRNNIKEIKILENQIKTEKQKLGIE